MALRKCLQISPGLRIHKLFSDRIPSSSLCAVFLADAFKRSLVWTDCGVPNGDRVSWPCSNVHIRAASTNSTGESQLTEKIVLYRAKWMRPLRLVVRLKVFQLGGVAALALPLAEYAEEGSLSLGTMVAVTAVVGGAGAASAALWYYSRRYMGEMALLMPGMRTVQLSVIDFWGNRQDLKYDIRDIVPPLKGMSISELEKASNQVLIPLDVIGDRQFYLNLRHAQFLQKEVLFRLLHGTLDLSNVQSLLSHQKAANDPLKVDAQPETGDTKCSIQA